MKPLLPGVVFFFLSVTANSFRLPRSSGRKLPAKASQPTTQFRFPFTVNSSSDDDVPPPPSQFESIVANAKSLLAIGKATRADGKDRKEVFLKSSIAGMAVTLAMIPEAVAFSFVAGVNPLVGLWTTVTLGFVAATLGGRAGICSSASGACSIVVAALCKSHGPSYLSACAILAGILQIFGGIIGLGKFIRLVPHPVMLGFVNGLAVLMTRSQLQHFNGMPFNTPAGVATYSVTAITMALVKLIPRFTKAIPPTLGAVTLATIATTALKLPVTTLADLAGAETFTGGWSVLPVWGLPAVPFSLATLRVVFPYAATMAAVGMIESLLTMQLVDGMMDDGKRGSTRQESIGQGAGNIVSGLSGGIGGCALLGQSIINVQSGGGISRWSGMSMSVFLGLGIVAAAPLLASVPISSLVGVMLLVCQSTFSWSSLRILRKIPKLDAFVIGLVSIITVQRDLAQAVVAGTIASALGFAWKQSTNLVAASSTMERHGMSRKLYELNGPLFFGSTSQFSSLFSPRTDPDEVIIDFSNSRVMDHSGLEAIHKLADQYGSLDKKIYIRHLSSDCTRLLAKLYKGGELPPYEVVEADPKRDPVYGVAESSEFYKDIAI